MGFYIRLAFAQVGHRPARWVLYAFGVALAVMIPLVSVGLSQVVAAKVVRNAIDDLPPGQRTVTITGQWWIYTSGHSQAEVDSNVVSGMRELSSRPIRRQMTYRQLDQNGSSFFLTATDGLASAVRLTSGRMPATCLPTRCEVVQLGSGQDPVLSRAAASLGVVVVGSAARSDDTFMSGTFDPGTTPVLVGDGVDAMVRLAPLANFGRTYGWVTHIDTDRVLALGTAQYLRRTNEVSDRLTIGYVGLGLEQTDQSLAAEDARARVSSQRFVLLGGAAAALLIGFGFVAAVSLRREHAALVRLLRMRGAAMPAIGAMTVVLVGAVVAAGALVGVGFGLFAAWALAREAALGTVLDLNEVWARGATGALSLAVCAVVVGAAVLLWPEPRQQAAWRVVEVAALAAMAVAWLAVSRGPVSGADLGARSDPALIALPVLVAAAAGLVAARVWPVATARARVLAGRSVVRSIALMSAARRPLRGASTAGFLAAGVCAVVFAGGYRATLYEGAADEAAAKVPTDFTITGSRDVPQPLAATSLASISAIAGGVSAHAVVRIDATVRATDGVVSSVPTLGVDAAAVSELRRWSRTSGGGLSQRDAAARLGVATTGNQFVPVPAGATGLALDVRGAKPGMAINAWFVDADGRQESAAVTASSNGSWHARLPALNGALSLASLSVAESDEYARRHLHAIGEGTADIAVLAGHLQLDSPRWLAGDAVMGTADLSSWTSAQSLVNRAGGNLEFDYRLTGAPVVVSTAPPASLPVLADPATAGAAHDGVLSLKVGDATVAARIVGILPRFPTLGTRFVVADRSALALVLGHATPGASSPSEVWVSAPSASLNTVAKAMDASPFDRLDVQSRAALERRLKHDPVATGSRTLLEFVAGLTALVALLSLALFVVGERRDDANELFAWEADGVRATTLRGVLLVRGVSMLVVAIPLGVVAGGVLSRVGAALVAVDASGVAPDPPLRASFAVASASLATAVMMAVGLAILAATAAMALRERLPVAGEVDLR